MTAAVQSLRAELAQLPEDPYLLYSTEATRSERVDAGALPGAASAIEDVVEAARGTDLVGLLASGPIMRGFASSIGARHWHAVDAFLLDWSLYHAGDKAVKCAWSGSTWDRAELRPPHRRGAPAARAPRDAAAHARAGRVPRLPGAGRPRRAAVDAELGRRVGEGAAHQAELHPEAGRRRGRVLAAGRDRGGHRRRARAGVRRSGLHEAGARRPGARRPAPRQHGQSAHRRGVRHREQRRRRRRRHGGHGGGRRHAARGGRPRRRSAPACTSATCTTSTSRIARAAA